MPPAHIPFIYRLCHLWLEPCAALGGTYQLAFAPQLYHTFMPQTAQYSPASQLIYTQLAVMYLFLAAIEAVVLRVTTELRVWKAVLFVVLLSDIGHVYALWMEMGTHVFFTPALWTAKDGVSMLTYLLPAILRIAFMLDVGLPEDDKSKKVI
jgi:hypothetical protein